MSEKVCICSQEGIFLSGKCKLQYTSYSVVHLTNVLGCYKIMAGLAYKQEKFVSQFIEARKPKIQVPTDSVSGKGTSWVIAGYLLAVSSHARQD